MEYSSNRPCNYHQDQKQLVDLHLAYRVASSVFVYPTTWRLRLLLTSRVWEPERDTRLWQDISGRIMGFAMLWSRRPENNYIVLDHFVHPDFVTEDLVDEMLIWGVNRAQTIAEERGLDLTLYTSVLDEAVVSEDALGAYGFVPKPHDARTYNLFFSQSLDKTFPRSELPVGYSIRTIHSIDELDTYYSMYSFAAVDPEHSLELLGSEEYLFLVVEDPEGKFVSFLECSFSRDEWALSGQRIGWIDYIGTRPEARRQGWGRVILLGGLVRLREVGAEMVMLVTVNTNKPAIKLYESTNFEVVDVPEPATFEKKIIFDQR
jgi:ribosomal protein S18 acetylase RimI-like enzyme